MERLRHRIQGLPKKVYDLILDFFFTAEPSERIIDKEYKQPSKLQVSHETREKFATTYYGSLYSYFNLTDKRLLCKWMITVPKNHLDLIHHISFYGADDGWHIPFKPPLIFREIAGPISLYRSLSCSRSLKREAGRR